MVLMEHSFVHSGPDIVIHHEENVLETMNDWSREQHTKSGLMELIRQSSISLYEAETNVIMFLERHCPMGTGILAGNSVFIDRWWVEQMFDRLTIWIFLSHVGLSRNICHVFMLSFIRVLLIVRIDFNFNDKK